MAIKTGSKAAMGVAIGAVLASGLAMAQSGVQKCAGPAYALADRLVGTWRELDVSNGVETLIGETVVTQEAGGCAFRQRFTSTQGDRSDSVARYDPASGGWIEQVAFSGGATIEYVWEERGEEIFVRLKGDGAATTQRRVAYAPRADGFEITVQTSGDRGATWRDGARSLFLRVK